MLDNQGKNTDTLRICTTYSFSTAIMVTRTRLIDMLFVYYLVMYRIVGLIAPYSLSFMIINFETQVLQNERVMEYGLSNI
jgi:hypothetical protein